MTNKFVRRLMGAAMSIGAVVALAATPLAFANVEKPAATPAATNIVNAGITVNAQNPSDNVHQVAKNVDPTNHQCNAAHPNTTADFVIYLSGVASGGSNFTAPITAFYHTQGNGTTSSFTATTGSWQFASRYAAQYKIVKIPVRYNATQYTDGPSYTSFSFVISSATNATVGNSTAIVYIVNGVHNGGAPGT